MMNMFSLNGKKAIITGGTRGLGKGIAEGLMEAGAEVTIIGSNENVYNVSNAFCNHGYKCHGVIADLSKSENRHRAFQESLNFMKGLDILVNAAGIQKRHNCEDFPLADWDDVLNVNLNAPFELCQLAAKEFIKNNKRGKIINISSMLAFFGGCHVPAYAASKGGITQMTKAFCNEWASKKINVNCIAPGYMDTDMNTALTNPDNPRYLEITNRIPQKRWGTPEDMKGCAVFLASSASDYVNGAVIPVDGGYLVK